MKRALLLFVLAVSSVSVVFAQNAQPASPSSQQLTLKEVVDIALQNNLRVRRSLYNVQSFNINLRQSKMLFLPTINGGASYGFNFGRSINPVTNIYTNDQTSALNMQIQSQWLLFNGFRVQNNYRQNIRDFNASNQDLEKAKNDVIINVVTLYINVIFNRELYEAARFQLISSQTLLERIIKQVAAGSLPKADQLNQEAQVATNEVNLVNQENAVNNSLLQLKQAMQLPASTQFDLVVPDLSPEDLVLDVGPDAIYQSALATMPEIKSAVLKVESADFALRASKGNLYPRLFLNGTTQSNYASASDREQFIQGDAPVETAIGYVKDPSTNVVLAPVYTMARPVIKTADSYPVSNQLNDNLYKTASLSLQIPIFNQLQNRSAVQRAAVNTELARLNQIEAENTLRQTIETSYNDALAASKTYTSSLKQVNAREEAARMNQQRFELGAINFVENQISENDLFRAKSDLLRAKYNFIFRKKILDFYQGKPIEY